MNRIIFVDDDEHILQGIRRLLRPMRNEWHVTFANSGDQALVCLETDMYDAIISDTRMPRMNGIELLNKVKESYPNMVRIGLSGQTEEELSILSTMSTHQQLTKPCEKDQLINTISTAIKQCDKIADDSLKNIITSTESLPSLPRLYNEINDTMRSDGGSLASVAKLIAQDIAVSAKILQLVNSAFFGIPRHISSAEKAVLLLGYDVIKALIVSTNMLNQFNEKQMADFNIDAIWDRSLILTSISKHLAKLAGLNKTDQDHAQITGMLLDIGILIMISNKPNEYKKVVDTQAASNQHITIIEKKVFGCTHAEVGAALLGIWGLPNEITDAVRYHLQPSKSDSSTVTPLTIAHLANVFYSEMNNENMTKEIDDIYTERLNINDKISTWRQVVSEELFEDQ